MASSLAIDSIGKNHYSYALIFRRILMTRISKQGERRHISHHRPKPPSAKSGPKKDNLLNGFLAHKNMAPGESTQSRFIPKIL